MTPLSVSIAAGQAVSNAIQLNAGELVTRLQFPSTWTTAGATILASKDGGVSYQEVYNQSGVYTLAAIAGTDLACDPSIWNGITNFKIQSGTSAAQVTQVSAAQINIAVA